MEVYRPLRGVSLIYIILLAVMWNIVMGVIMLVVNSYTVLSLIRVAVLGVNGYFLYFIAVSLSVKYVFGSNYISIKSLWGLRNIKIPFDSIEGYKVCNENIRGVKLSGIGNSKFAFGRSIIDKIGTTHMFVTSSRNTIYIKTASIAYSVSPKDLNRFESRLKSLGILNHIGNYQLSKNTDLYKQKEFFIPFIIVTVIIIVLTLNPFILYLKNLLPEKIPLSFDSSFVPIKYGTGKQFAFIQMIYGVLNMVVLLCMYYASYFCAKYDRKSAYRYIYIAMITAATFLFTQLKILITFG